MPSAAPKTPPIWTAGISAPALLVDVAVPGAAVVAPVAAGPDVTVPAAEAAAVEAAAVVNTAAFVAGVPPQLTIASEYGLTGPSG
jgi:hypothetical protein